MDKNNDLRVCTQECRIPHYENCGTCFGFGVYSDRPGDIVIAVEAHGKRQFREAVIACPECGSIEKGYLGR